MNIKQAKEQIQQAVEAYRVKNEFGEPAIAVERQRPIFLMGPPGIGKTAIMEQIAQELGIGLVSYSMTHHTRQSALGLPFIVHKTYRGREYDVSEYTMSEIIASVYDRIEQDGAEEGILFLDEINCVSETLAPSMLQFLQYKTFGRHSVPEGWTVVTAGNPPEYNSSVREFDIVTWDRLKRIDVEPDFDVWKEYAVAHGVHPAVLTYLEIRKEDFYVVETTVDGKRFVTARGWVDLSDMMKLYEQKGFAINEQLIRQYLQNQQIAKRFAVYVFVASFTGTGNKVVGNLPVSMAQVVSMTGSIIHSWGFTQISHSPSSDDNSGAVYLVPAADYQSVDVHFTCGTGYSGIKQLFLVVEYTKDTDNPVFRPLRPMTSNSSINCVASASSVLNTNDPAWHAFDGLLTTIWSSKDVTGEHWIQIQLPEPLKNIVVDVYSRDNATTKAPTQGKVMGSNNGSSWTQIGSYSGWDDTLVASLVGKVECHNSTAYSYVRLTIDNLRGSNYIIGNILIHGDR